MATRARNLFSTPGVPSHLEDIYTGHTSWELIYPFPQQDEADRKEGTLIVEEVRDFVRAEVDPEQVDRSGRLPDGLVGELKRRGYLALRVPTETGGRGLSNLNLFRVVEAVAGWSPPVALVLAIDNAIGLGALLPALPPGPLQEEVRRRLAGGVVSGSADTEPSGAANFRRATTAVPVENGTAYLLSGEKVHIGNGPVAETLAVTARVLDGAGEPNRMFVVDCDTPGFQLVGRHEFMGLRGFPNGAFRLDGVRVPAERMVIERPREHGTRITPEGAAMVLHGRMYLIAAPSLAIARLCAEWSRDFVGRRVIDQRPLGGYEQVQRMLAATLAETFALDSVVQWCLLAGVAGHGGPAGVNAIFDQNAAKNISSVLCWRIVDRTMSLLAGEGYETAASKAARGAPALPLERFYRDARALRISGGVDFQIDYWTAQMGILSYYYPDPPDDRVLAPRRDGRPAVTGALSPRNQAHATAVTDGARQLARNCLELARGNPDPSDLYRREWTLILLSRWANELFTMSLTLARAATLAAAGQPYAQRLADVYCTGAARRLSDIQRRLAEAAEPAYAELSDAWLAGTPLDALVGGHGTRARPDG